MKTGKTKRRRKNFFPKLLGRDTKGRKKKAIEQVIEQETGGQTVELVAGESLSRQEERTPSKKEKLYSRNSFEKFAYEHFSRLLPRIPRYREAFEQAGLPMIFESYMSTGIFLSLLALVPAVAASSLAFIFVLHDTLFVSILEGISVGGLTFAISLLLWILYPLQRRRSFKARLESQLPYSFGILGVLSAAGINVERMFERIAVSDSNPILAGLARRFIRNIKIFGLDTETALREVAKHSPSVSFSKMLESIAVAFRTTGSVHELIMFESTRLLTEKSDKLKKKIGDLAIMAELYITLVVVGPIIFIVMLSILQLLPYSGSIPSIPAINALVFVGIPAISIGFILMLDSFISRI